ncbi:MAG: hypothetical protein H6617_10190 [Bdellovibrionaceae bacterium]|nr:hypothetical protein [Bdellovibrionales bacterium]MCB9255040.1 hypothetical protein [Pseudobdellovibrionaceae bacterium]
MDSRSSKLKALKNRLVVMYVLVSTMGCLHSQRYADVEPDFTQRPSIEFEFAAAKQPLSLRVQVHPDGSDEPVIDESSIIWNRDHSMQSVLPLGVYNITVERFSHSAIRPEKWSQSLFLDFSRPVTVRVGSEGVSVVRRSY